MKNKTFYSHGKLLLTGEYVVLDGAISLAIPTKFGQSLTIKPIEESFISWKSFDEANKIWFENDFKLNDNLHDEIPKRLIQVLNAAKDLNPDFLNKVAGFKVETHLEFPINWGLGTSSTLINNMAQWANIDAYTLLEKTFGGSGYDIACAQFDTPITYQRDHNKPIVKSIKFAPSFNEHLYFVHLNKKQNSRDAIKHYHQNKENAQSAINAINKITSQMIACKTLKEFQGLIVQHETIIAKITKQTPVKDLLFKDFNGAIKSLGAWGGDFIMVASKNNPVKYFTDKGYKTIIPYNNMVL
ncbi:GYDIA family GHMP kinase [uncultured Algibacter sp.]|uniref:GYDIA family GHMP kinase n=1 Tax=uncultured Algibacter sp. TaxID=298659 RepID=UPI0026229A10|nr:GYDIA family GHMP kinase [uncultured Algibacter sp.]